LDGASLAPLIAAPSKAPASASAGRTSAPDYEMESFFPAYSYNWSPTLALVSGKWQYIGRPRAELSDLHADPPATTNLLAAAEEARGAATRLAASLRARYRSDAPARAFGAPPCASAIEPRCTKPTAASRPSSGSGKVSSDSHSDDDAEQRERLAALGYVGG